MMFLWPKGTKGFYNDLYYGYVMAQEPMPESVVITCEQNLLVSKLAKMIPKMFIQKFKMNSKCRRLLHKEI